MSAFAFFVQMNREEHKKKIKRYSYQFCRIFQDMLWEVEDNVCEKEV